MRWRELVFDPKTNVATNFNKVIVDPIRKFCSKPLDIPAVISGILSEDTLGDKVAEQYQRRLFGKTCLRDLPSTSKEPEFIFYAASLQTGDGVIMSREGIYDYKVGKIYRPGMLLAKVVGASSAFPPIFSPVVLEYNPGEWEETKYSSLYHKPQFKDKLYLTDGGVYDNMGLEAVWNDGFKTVLVCDAGAPWTDLPRPWTNPISQLYRVFSVTGAQGGRQRKRLLIDNLKEKDAKGKPIHYGGTYWGIATDIDDYELEDPMVNDNQITSKFKNVRTRLNSFKPEDQGHLINWGYALTDTALRRWYFTDKHEKGIWPIPEYALDQYCPGYVKRFFAPVYPAINWDRIEFHKGLPGGLGKLITRQNTAAITLCSWKSNKIDIYFKEDRWEPWRSTDGMALIGHELFHTKDIMSVCGGKGWGLLQPWFIAYLFCLLLSRWDSGRKHYLEKTAYNIEDALRKYFSDEPLSDFTKIPLGDAFLNKYLDNESIGIIKLEKRSIVSIFTGSIKQAFGKR